MGKVCVRVPVVTFSALQRVFFFFFLHYWHSETVEERFAVEHSYLTLYFEFNVTSSPCASGDFHLLNTENKRVTLLTLSDAADAEEAGIKHGLDVPDSSLFCTEEPWKKSLSF